MKGVRFQSPARSVLPRARKTGTADIRQAARRFRRIPAVNGLQQQTDSAVLLFSTLF